MRALRTTPPHRGLSSRHPRSVRHTSDPLLRARRRLSAGGGDGGGLRARHHARGTEATAGTPFQLQDAQGSQIAWVESRIGPARQGVGPERVYEIGACSVRMMAEGQDIVRYATLASFRVQEIEVGYRPIVRCGELNQRC